MSNFFKDLPEVPKESPFFSNEYEEDTRKEKINANIGMIYNDEGKLHELSFIKDVEKELFDKKLDKEYSSLIGSPDYNNAVFKLFFPEQELKDGGNFFSTQSITGGSALRVGSDLLRKAVSPDIYLSNLTFSLYYKLFSECNINQYPYYSHETKEIDFKGMTQYLEYIPDKSVINLQLSNHNPTGLDLSKEQWDQLALVFKKKNHFAFFDCAYLGHSSGSFSEDLYGLHSFLNSEIEFFLAFSSAKISLNYGEDVGSLLGWMKNPTAVKKVVSNILNLNRALFSFPSLQGARILTNILQNRRQEQEKELREIHSELKEKRQAVVESMSKKGMNEKTLGLIKSQKGIYLFLDLSEDQVIILKKNYSIYLADNGRA
eukprot:CAMPEP_0170515008 /NCGR_PEP_ID=MMETSP0209-20121228/1493_1 /TAXON_ID=665100 ORGANISM="Litonotus pictus, Strain P1" /NCGR_SAMPLE_ID=MMETSP0209 /ASSEMBLY_ACC=CAM_ASM_000301 /LENGTH=373 /DNA_ID=CAMNT_0010799299 /DNA_START=23 /DNA_END=1140 /DNA_ORIENTATION=+